MTKHANDVIFIDNFDVILLNGYADEDETTNDKILIKYCSVKNIEESACDKLLIPLLRSLAVSCHNIVDYLDQRQEKGTKIRKRRNQKKIPTPKTEAGKNQTNNQVLIP